MSHEYKDSFLTCFNTKTFKQYPHENNIFSHLEPIRQSTNESCKGLFFAK